MARPRLQTTRGMTIIEIVILIGVAMLLFGGFALAYHAYKEANAIYKLTWRQAPSTIPPTPANGTFIYHVTRQQDLLSPVVDFEGRSLKFDLAVTKGAGKIMSCNSNAVSSPGTTCTDSSNASGDVTIIVQLEPGAEATLTATDLKSGKSDPPQTFTTTP